VGVVKDFNSRSLHTEMQPVAMAAWKALYQTLNVKIEGTGSLPKIESIWKETYPAYVYQYEFLDKKLESFYKDDDRLSQLYKLFAGIALFISCLGLYGLVSFMAVQRTKEVGIRKVLGATVANIVYLFSREFTILVGLSFLIAAPIGWYLMHRWLQQFSYRVHPGVTAFGATLLGSMVIAWLTVGYKSIKAALASPVKSLKAE
jgi:ABC-type antimicrobial peptide transport system permease subunit